MQQGDRTKLNCPCNPHKNLDRYESLPRLDGAQSLAPLLSCCPYVNPGAFQSGADSLTLDLHVRLSFS